jgi:hypothetical protein
MEKNNVCVGMTVEEISKESMGGIQTREYVKIGKASKPW